MPNGFIPYFRPLMEIFSNKATGEIALERRSHAYKYYAAMDGDTFAESFSGVCLAARRGRVEVRLGGNSSARRDSGGNSRGGCGPDGGLERCGWGKPMCRFEGLVYDLCHGESVFPACIRSSQHRRILPVRRLRQRVSLTADGKIHNASCRTRRDATPHHCDCGSGCTGLRFPDRSLDAGFRDRNLCAPAQRLRPLRLVPQTTHGDSWNALGDCSCAAIFRNSDHNDANESWSYRWIVRLRCHPGRGDHAARDPILSLDKLRLTSLLGGGAGLAWLRWSSRGVRRRARCRETVRHRRSGRWDWAN